MQCFVNVDSTLVTEEEGSVKISRRWIMRSRQVWSWPRAAPQHANSKAWEREILTSLRCGYHVQSDQIIPVRRRADSGAPPEVEMTKPRNDQIIIQTWLTRCNSIPLTAITMDRPNVTKILINFVCKRFYVHPYIFSDTISKFERISKFIDNLLSDYLKPF